MTDTRVMADTRVVLDSPKPTKELLATALHNPVCQCGLSSQKTKGNQMYIRNGTRQDSTLE